MFSFVTYLAARTITGAGDSVREGFADKIAAFFDYMIGRVPSWIAGFIVFVLTIFFSKIAKSAVEGRISNQLDEEHQEILVLAGRVTYFGTLILGITIALKIAGIDLTTILAAVAFGIGFALQDLIMNFLSGVLILVSRQFTIGDFIKVGSTTGKVMEIQTRATILKAFDGTKVIVPNSEIFRNQVTSYTTNPTRRVVIPLYVSYDTDIKYAMKIVLGVIKRQSKILKKPAPSIVVSGYGDSSIDLSARFWVGSRDGWFKIKSDINREMLAEFSAAGIIIPYNILHVETGQDTVAELKEAAELRAKRIEEMKLSKAIHDDAQEKTAVADQGSVPVTTPPNVQATLLPAPLPLSSTVVPTNAPAMTSASDSAPALANTPAHADTNVAGLTASAQPIIPEGTYQEEAEIDTNG